MGPYPESGFANSDLMGSPSRSLEALALYRHPVLLRPTGYGMTA